jgi:hypothetical protein
MAPLARGLGGASATQRYAYTTFSHQDCCRGAPDCAAGSAAAATTRTRMHCMNADAAGGRAHGHHRRGRGLGAPAACVALALPSTPLSMRVC